ncbi:MAG: hypothetical protein EA349_07365 [Halomonadaceae bacterium]|nr:MAG: hypothetical protein EA349_07365 [Halomonadaceae bacterium]
MKRAMKPLMLVIMAGVLSFVAGPVAAHGCHEEHHGHDEKSALEVHSGKGELRDIQAENQRVTLWHEPMVSLGWPEMTMEFELASPELTDGFEAGQKVLFKMTSEDGRHTIIHLEKP